MPRIFISYRRSDSKEVVSRFYDHLVRSFGKANIFKDIDSIPLGMDFREAIQSAISKVDVVLAIIGQSWLEARDEAGQLRLQNPEDYVRIELETAVLKDLSLIPILLDDTRMPEANVPPLPSTLNEITFRNAAKLRADPDLSIDLKRIVYAIKTYSKADVLIPSHGGKKVEVWDPANEEQVNYGFQKILSWLLGRQSKRTKELALFLQEVEGMCLELIEIDDPRSDRAKLLHEQLKAMYSVAQERLPSSFCGSEAWDLFRAISSARIYFWLRFFEDAEWGAFQTLLDERYQKSPSLEALSNLIRSSAVARIGKSDSTIWRNSDYDVSELDIESVKRICLADIAKIRSVKPIFVD